MKKIKKLIVKVSKVVSTLAGNPYTLALAFVGLFLWAILGPIMNYSDTWQLIINTTTTIFTFITTLSIQYTQNRDNKTITKKLSDIEQELDEDD